MNTVIDFPQRNNFDRHQLWDRFERADVFEQYLDLQAQGVSQRQAAKRLQVPRSTLQAWRSWHDTLDIVPRWPSSFKVARDLLFCIDWFWPSTWSALRSALAAFAWSVSC